MNRAAGRRTWEAARDRGVRPLSWRMYLTLAEIAASKHGQHCANNGDAAFALERKGLVAVDAYPFAHVTPKGRELLAEIAQAAL